jgi:hypothetical protein
MTAFFFQLQLQLQLDLGQPTFSCTRQLHCTSLHCTALHCTSLHCATLHCTALHTALHYSALLVLYSVAMCITCTLHTEVVAYIKSICSPAYPGQCQVVAM